jgi:formylglycine-generating enzyme required for sulfatase activity
VRLPTEAEWEYVCRAGTDTEFYFGDEPNALSEHAWFDLNSNECTHPVGLKQPNPWGLHDIVGNVWEWCEDVWHGDYSGAPLNGSAWMANQDKQERRSVRGAAWNMDGFRCRSSYRSYDWKDAATNRLGFRIVLATE